jgi:hypothetical protein
MSDRITLQPPVWAKAVIVARFRHSDTDMQTDYFASHVGREVALAYSRHTRDLFAEMRQAAARFAETADLGPGLNRYTVAVVFTETAGMHAKGDSSHWHTDLTRDEHYNPRTFNTRAAAEAYIAQTGEPFPVSDGGALHSFAWEIREESIMGGGYYLMDGWRHSGGWQVAKVAFYAGHPLTVTEDRTSA